MPNNETGNQTGNDIQHKDPITVNDTTTRPSVPSVPSTLDSERVDLLAQLATVRSTLTSTTKGLGDEQAGLTVSDDGLLQVELPAYGYRWLRAGTPADDPERVAVG